MEDNKLMVLVKESGLETTKAQVLLDQFSGYFKMAADWEKKARGILVTDISQKPDMQMARVGRLFLRGERIAIEKTRKALKEQALREGKAIDGIANVLKALIVPIEEYLEKQERFAEIKAAEERERLHNEALRKAEEERVAAEKKAEAERIAKEKAEAAERERIRKENERLQKEAKERERAIAEERAKVAAERERKEKERLAYEASVKKEREVREAKIKAEKEKADAERRAYEARVQKEREEREAKAEAERVAYEAKARKEREEAAKKARLEREEKEREIAAQKAKAEAERVKAEELKAKLAAMITCPFCGKSFSPNDKGPSVDAELPF